MKKALLVTAVLCLSVSCLLVVWLDPLDELNEASGLTPSALHPGIFWSLNDSGGRASLFAINDRRQVLAEISIADADNVDWEAVTSDGAGHLYIGDIGNNNNRRRDLTIYRIREPSVLPTVGGMVMLPAERYHFSYVEQRGFPDEDELNFDAEALFFLPAVGGEKGTLHLLTKHRSNHQTVLYAFPEFKDGATGHPRRLAALELGGEEHWFGGRTTGAAFHPSKRLLAVLTYHRIFIFRVANQTAVFSELVASVELQQSTTQQVEGIAWKGEALLMVNEQEDIFEIPKSVWSRQDAEFPPSN